MTGAPPLVNVAVASPREVIAFGVTELLAQHGDRIRVVALDPSDEDTHVDVLVLDEAALGSPGAPGLDAWSGLAKGIVLLTVEHAAGTLARAVDAGGVGAIVPASASAEHLVATIEAVASGTHGDLGPLHYWPGKEHGLTRRESEVLLLIASGLSNQEIAEHLYLSLNSVKTYIRTGYRKIGVDRRQQAVIWCLQHAARPPVVTSPQE